MPAPLLLTKLYIPSPRPKVVPRPRLVERLNEGLSSGCKLTLISASAGFGKTTLVSEWVSGVAQQREQKVGELKVPTAAWLSLDEGDNDPTRFLMYLIAALQTIDPGMGAGALAVLQSPEPPPIESILIALLNEITSVPNNFILVLDDYHVIDSKPVAAALTFFLEHLPPQMHLVIASREDPHLPIARLRARGQLTELRAADLRFTPAEAAEFLNQFMGLVLSAEDIAALDKRTEGWIAGLQLASLALQGLSMHGHQDSTSFIQTFTGSHHFVLDYLVEEVLQQQSERIKTFLLRTSILDRLCGPLCDAVVCSHSVSGQETDGQETARQETARQETASQLTLDYLEHANLFIVPLDNERRWYRYHHLFGDVLRMHLMAEQPDQVSALHQRASEWYEHNGSAADAIRHALAAKDFERAAGLIELAVPEMRRSRRGATVTELGWLKAIPDALVRFRPVLSVAYAFALFGGGEPGGVEPRLRDAERWLDLVDPLDSLVDMHARPESRAAGMVVVDKEEFRRLPGMIALLRAAQALARGEMPEAVKNARRVLDLAPEDAHLMLGGADSVLGLAAWAIGDLDAARRMTLDGMVNVRRAGYISSAIGGAIVLADIQIAQGHLHEAMDTYERALQWATEAGAPVQRGAADMYVGMSELHREHNDLMTATQQLLSSRALGDLAGLPQNPYRWCAAMARIRQAQGDLNGALDFLDQAEHLYNGAFSPNVRPIATRKLRVWVTQGRLGEALGWVRAQGLSVDNDLSYLQEFDHITLARVLLACYRNDSDGSISEVMRLLERLLKAAEERGGIGSMIELLVLQAIAFHAQGDLPAALLPLKRALALAEPEGYVRMFLDEGAGMLQLLREASARQIMPRQGLPTYIDRLLAAFEAEELNSIDKPDLPPAQTLIDPEAQPAKSMLVEPQGQPAKSMLVWPLSQRELEILKLIAHGLSNREIGERLFLALDTVKGHNRRIFDKLQVESRTEAVARARELGLL